MLECKIVRNKFLVFVLYYHLIYNNNICTVCVLIEWSLGGVGGDDGGNRRLERALFTHRPLCHLRSDQPTMVTDAGAGADTADSTAAFWTTDITLPLNNSVHVLYMYIHVHEVLWNA